MDVICRINSEPASSRLSGRITHARPPNSRERQKRWTFEFLQGLGPQILWSGDVSLNAYTDQSMILSNIQEPEYLTLASRALDVCRLDEVSVQIELPWSNASYIRPTFQNTSKVYSRRPITILHPPMWRQTRPCGGERKVRASNFCDPPTPRVGSQCWRGD